MILLCLLAIALALALVVVYRPALSVATAHASWMILLMLAWMLDANFLLFKSVFFARNLLIHPAGDDLVHLRPNEGSDTLHGF